jgi:hypothetical protein
LRGPGVFQLLNRIWARRTPSCFITRRTSFRQPVGAPGAGRNFASQNYCSPMRQGLVVILLRKITARPCNLDCSGKPAGFAPANPRTWSGKPGPRPRERPGEAPK